MTRHALLFPFALSAFLATAVAAPFDASGGQSSDLILRATPTQPKACVPNHQMTEAQTKARAGEFANAFMMAKDIHKVFTYIAEGYINHNPMVGNGASAAWRVLAPIWSSMSITPLGTAFVYPQSWLHYNNGAVGTVVDRFRWEGGCIVEHWDQGEKFPGGA